MTKKIRQKRVEEGNDLGDIVVRQGLMACGVSKSRVECIEPYYSEFSAKLQ